MAARIAQSHKVGVVGALLNHEPPPLTRNHARDNVRKLRELQQKRRDSKFDAEVRAAEAARPFKMKQFEGAGPRIYEERAAPAGIHANPPAPKRDEFLRKAEGKLVQPKLPDEGVARPQDVAALEQKPPVPRASEAAPRAPEVDKNFVRQNRQAAIAGQGYAGKENQGQEDPVADRLRKIHGNAAFRRDQGNVPAYIQNRKEEMAENRLREQREAQAERERVPDGYRLLPEEERAETLEALGTKKQEMEAAFRRLPMKIETEAQKKRQKDLLDQIKEVEDALRLFSKPKVYVQL